MKHLFADKAPTWKPARWAGLLSGLMVLLLAGAGTGCQALAAGAYMMPRNEKAAYKGMTNQTVAVMVYADKGVLIDYPDLQLDLANTVQSKLQASKAPEMKGTTYPLLPATIVRYQRDHPELEAMDVREIAPRFRVTRLLYIEINDFRTRSNISVELYRGTISANVRVLEIADGKATVAYSEDDLQETYPPKALPEGTPNTTDAEIYEGIVDSFAEDVVDRCATHPIQEE